MDRLLNYVFSFIVIYLFVLVANAEEHTQIMAGIAIALALSFIAFAVNWLTFDGALAASVAGSITFGFGGLPAAIILIGYFVTGTLLTKPQQSIQKFGEPEVGRRRRRNGIQVWVNSFWFVALLCIWFIFQHIIFLIAALSAISTATSDTWATEIGLSNKWGKTYVIKGFRKVQPGTDGGISISGTLGGSAGSLLIGLLAYIIFPQIEMVGGGLIAVMGFVGCQVDSYLGALFQYEARTLALSWLGMEQFSLDNNGVNLAATGIGSLSSLILIYILMLT